MNTPNLIRLPEVKRRTGLSRSTIYAKKDKNSPSFDPNFPAPVKIGPRASAWPEDAILAWIEAQKDGREILTNEVAAKPKNPKRHAAIKNGKAVNQHAMYDWTNVKKIVTGNGNVIYESDSPNPKIPPGLSGSSE